MSGRARSRRGLRLLLVVSVVVGITATLSHGQHGPAPAPRAVAASGTVVYIPATAHASGANGASWRTDLEVHNPGGSTASFTIQLLRRDAVNSSPASRSYTLDAQKSRRFVDVLVSEFATEGAAALRIAVTSGSVLVTSRTYNLIGDNPWGLPKGASFGQYVPGWDESAAIGYGQEGRLVHLTQQPASSLQGFRTNLGLVNATASPIAVRVDLYRADGTWLGKKEGADTSLPAYGFRQLDQVFAPFGTVADGWALVKTTTPGGKLLAFATLIDNHNSGDPVFVPAAPAPPVTAPTPGPTATPTRTPTRTPTPTPTRTPTPGPTPAARPNLVLYTPTAWPACFVVHSSAGCCTSSACCTPSPSATGSSFIQLFLANTGSATAYGVVRFSLAVDGIPAGAATWSNDTGLEPGFGIVLTWEYTGTIVPGIHDATITIDPDDTIAESNEADNSCTTTVDWGGAPLFVESSGREAKADALSGGNAVPLARRAPPAALETEALQPSTGPIYVPASAHASGVNGASWRTDLEVHNPGATAVTFDVVLLPQNADNGGSPATRRFSLGPQQSVRYADALASLFGFTGAAALRLTSTPGPILANSRTYNLIGPNTVGLPVGASFGQFVPGLPEAEAIGYGEEGRLIQLSHRDSSALTGFRTNLGLVNTTGSPIDVKVDLYKADGAFLGTVKDPATRLPRWGFAQVNAVFGPFASSLEDGYAVVRTSTPGGRFFAFATVIDNHLTGDPIFVPAQRVATAWVTAGSGTIGPAGGTVSGGGLTVTVPSGTFSQATALTITKSSTAATPHDRFRTTDVFRLDGLPDGRAKAVTLTLDVTRSPGLSGASFVAAANEVFVPTGAGLGSPPMLLPATRAASRVSATIPPASAPAATALSGAAAPSLAADVQQQFTIWGIAGYAELLSAQGHFRVNYPVTDLLLGSAEEIAGGLETAYTKIAALGFDWSRRTSWPVYVSIEPFPADIATRLAECVPSRWGLNSYWLHVNADRLNVQADIPLMRDAAAHELFHLVQYLYDSRNRITMARNPGAWYWADEATAVWFENHFNGSSAPPQVVRENHAFMMKRGLEFPPPGDDPALAGPVQDHGYGAAELMRDLSRRKGDAAVGELVRRKSNSYVLPADAYDLQTGASAESTWRLFVDEYAQQHLYGGFPTAADVWVSTAGNRYAFASASTTGTTFNWTAPDLSARFYGIQFTDKTWPAGTDVSLLLTDPEKDAISLVYKLKSGQLTRLGYHLDGDVFKVENAETFANDGTSLVVLVANGRASRPYTGTTPISLSVSAGERNELEFYVPGKECPGAPQVSMQFKSALDGYGLRWTSPTTVEVDWSGSVGTDNQSEYSGRATLSPDRRTLSSLVFTSHSVTTIPPGTTCGLSGCRMEHWESITWSNVPPAGDWRPAQYHFAATGPPARASITAYSFRVKYSGFTLASENYDCTYPIDESRVSETRIHLWLTPP
jgi:hypothetical protein